MTTNQTKEADKKPASEEAAEQVVEEKNEQAEQVETESDSVVAENNEADETLDEVADTNPGKDAEALAAALDKIKSLEDQILRDKAETQNVRRRVQKDVEHARKFALEKFVAELLPVIDNLERALSTVEEHESVQEGIQLTLKSFLGVLEKFNVTVVDPMGEPFDANFHEAMTMVPNPKLEPNTVMDVMQKGYVLNQRLVRPAMVIVSKVP